MDRLDKKFNELGYRKIYDKDNAVSYHNQDSGYELTFDKNYKCVEFSNDIGEYVFGNTLYGTLDLDLEILDLICKKCKQLGFKKENN